MHQVIFGRGCAPDPTDEVMMLPRPPMEIWKLTINHIMLKIIMINRTVPPCTCSHYCQFSQVMYSWLGAMVPEKSLYQMGGIPHNDVVIPV